MSLVEALMSVPKDVKLKVVEEDKVYTRQELMNEPQYDGSLGFIVNKAHPLYKGRWVILENRRVFAFSVES